MGKSFRPGLDRVRQEACVDSHLPLLLVLGLRSASERPTSNGKISCLRPHFRHASLARWMAELFLLSTLHARACMYCDDVLWFAGESTEVTCEGEARHDRLHQSQCLSGQVSFPRFLQYCACCMIDMMDMYAIGHALDLFCVV